MIKSRKTLIDQAPLYAPLPPPPGFIFSWGIRFVGD